MLNMTGPQQRLWTLAVPFVLLFANTGVPGFLDPDAIPVYMPHPPITIEGEEDLTPENGVVGGSGTKEDPYSISGWALIIPPYPMKTGAIRISNVTDAHVSIEDNFLTGKIPGADGGCAIVAKNVSFLTIADNVFEQTINGVCARDSRDLVVSHNFFNSTNPEIIVLAASAIALRNTDDSKIVGNKISGFWGGISLNRESNGNLVQGNLLERNREAASITLISGSQYNLVYNNTIRDGPGTGIGAFSDANRIINNTIDGLGGSAIWVGSFGEPVHDIQVLGNDIKNVDRAFRLTCLECEVSYNAVRNAEETSSGTGGSGLVWRFNVVESSGKLFLNQFYARNNSFPQDEPFEVVTQNQTDLRYNWWSDPSGPRDGSIAGTDLIAPWLSEPPAGLF